MCAIAPYQVYLRLERAPTRTCRCTSRRHEQCASKKTTIPEITWPMKISDKSRAGFDKLRIVFAILVTLLAHSCIVMQKPIASPNPTSYVFNKDIDQTRDAIFNMFTNSKYQLTIGYTPAELQSRPELVSNNKNNIFINRFAITPTDTSVVYHTMFRNCLLLPVYHLTLESVATTATKVSIESYPVIFYGFALDWNHRLPYITKQRRPVKQSTIEEYRLLLGIGMNLEERGMPALTVP